MSNQNIGPMSDNEEEKNEKFKKEGDEMKIYDEKIESETAPDKNTAFAMYKTESNQAKEIEQSIFQNSEDLKKRKYEAKHFLEQCNIYKTTIDKLKLTLNDKKLNKLSLGDEMTELIDEEGYKLIDELKGVKESYKDNLDKFKFAKSEINVLKNNLDLLKVKYIESFESWFYKKFGMRLEENELKLSKVTFKLYIFKILRIIFQNKYGLSYDDVDLNNRQVDPDEQAYFNAKKKVQSIHKAKKMEKKK